MDLKSFYKKIDVDSIKNKLPPLKLPKLKSRKIFKSSREDLANQQQQSPSKALGINSPLSPQSLPGHSPFIDRTPTRISTVSSLMNINYGFRDKRRDSAQQHQSTYKTASNFEEENCPDEYDTREPASANGNSVGRFSDKCKKTYKDFSEFKIKHIFTKKTVVRRTEIEVDIYARQYEQDNYLEERYLENQLEEDGYQFEFKEARRRLSGSSGSISPPDSLASGVPSPIRSELGHLQQNNTPPLLAKRRNAITHAELMRQKSQNRSLSSDSNDEPPRKPMRSSLWGLHEENSQSELDQTDKEQVQVHRPTDSRLMKFKKSVKEGFRDSISAESGDDQQRTGISSRMAKFKKQMKRGVSDDKDPPPEMRPEQSEAQRPGTSRMARLKQSMKEGLAEGFMDRHHPAESGDDTERPAAEPSRMARFKRTMKEGFSDKNMPAESGGEDQPSTNKPGPSRISRFKQSMKAGLSEKQIPTESGDDQPKAAPSKMARFKKSMRARMPESTTERPIPTESGNEQAQQPQKNISRMAKFKRSVKEGISGESGDEQQKPSESRISKFKKSMKEGMTPEFDSTWNLKGIRSRFNQDETAAEPKSKKNLQSQESLDDHSDIEKKPWALKNIHLRRGGAGNAEPAEKNNEPAAVSSPEGKFSSIKMSINRLKNRKPPRQTSEESEAEATREESPKQNMSNQLKAGLRRLKMRERSLTFDEDDAKTPKEPQTTSRLQNWKKSIKIKRSNEPPTEDTGTEGAQQPSSPLGRSRTLIRKLNHIRSRKEVSEDDADSGDPTQANEQQKQKSKNMEKLEQARAKALQKVNEQVRKMRNFHGKSNNSLSEGSPEKPGRKKKPEQGEKGKPLSAVLSSHSLVSQLSLDDNEEASPVKTAPNKTYKFEHGTRPPKNLKRAPLAGSGSMESSLSLEDDDGVKAPVASSRVVIHQDNSDNIYDTTLTISVSRPAPAVPQLSVPKDTMPKTKYQAPKTDWIPNKSAISSFLEMTPSPESSQQQLDVNNRPQHGHMRKRSMDSNDSDSWIPENFRNKSCSSSASAGLNKITENTEPWKVNSTLGQDKLYKAKSIDIFANPDHGCAFKDFDDEMKNVPVRRILAASAESLSKPYAGSTDEDDDYDNSSRITRIKQASPMTSTTAAVEPIRNSTSFDSSTTDNNAIAGGIVAARRQTAQIGNSQESLDANYDENEELSSGGDDDDDDEEDDIEDAPDMAPSPPPSFSPPPPPLPTRKPPRMIPERNDSMVRLAHPLVKQGSLRRLYIEEIEPSDLGKVNKLINRFEKTPSNENVPRIQLIPSDDNDFDDILKIEEPIIVPKPKENGGAKKRPTVSHPPDIVSDANDNVTRNETNNNNNVGNSKKCQSRSGTSDEDELVEPKKMTRSSSKRRQAPIPKQQPSIVTSTIQDNNLNNNNNIDTKKNDLRTIQEQQRGAPSPDNQENLDNISIQSPNESIYGSPIGSICLSERISTSSVYGSPIGAAYTARNSGDPMRSNRRLSIRSSIRDDDTFYSFESDEENNFYSLGDSSDVRYVIEI